MDRIREQLKSNNFDHVYLLYGEEQKLVQIFRNYILKGLTGTDSLEALKQDINFSVFVGTPFDIDSAVEIAQSYPFMGDKRVILIENTKAFGKDGNKLAECVKNLPETTYMIFTEDKISDKKGLYAAIKEIGHIAEFTTQKEEDADRYVIKYLSKADIKISKSALSELYRRVGYDLMRITSELDKLISYKADTAEIKFDDVCELVAEDPSEQVFKLVDAIGNKDTKLAMKYYYDMLEMKTSPQNILHLIERQMRILYQVKEMRSKGFDAKAIKDSVKELSGKNIWITKNAIGQASKFKERDITECLKDCVDLLLQSRTGAISDRMAVELIIVKYSGG